MKADRIQPIADGHTAESQLPSSEDLFSKVLRVSPLPISISRFRDGLVLDVNEAFERVLGYRRDDVIGKRSADLGLWPKDPDTRTTMLERLRTDGRLTDFRARLQLDSGLTIECILSGEIFTHENEQFLILTIWDITEQSHAIAALRESESFTNSLVRTANVIIVALDLDGRVIMFNPAAERITGYTRAELEGRSWFETLVPRERYPYVYEAFGRLQSGTLARSFENPILTKDGQERIITWSNSELRHRGKIVGTISFGVDITNRKKAEEALQLTQSAVDRTSDAVFWVRPDGTLGYVNDEACRFTEYSREELLTMGVNDIDLNYSVDRVSRLLEELRESKNALIESAITSKSGRTTPVEIRVSYVDFAGEEYLFAFVRDITERKRAEEELLRLNKELQAEQRALEDKNIALRSVLEHLESERLQYKHELCDSVEKLIAPAITKLEHRDGSLTKKEVASLKTALDGIIRRDIDQFSSNMNKLSARELDVCELIKQGYSSKEIAAKMGISAQTIHTHRHAIRRKLQIKNKAINLAAYLRSRTN
jgi:PAS domain S-box-containing protein